jgi:hypothetical protein
VELSQFEKRIVCFEAEVEQLFGILDEHSAGIREAAISRRTVKQSFPKFLFKFANGLADSGLGSVKFLSGAREAFFVRYGDERL